MDQFLIFYGNTGQFMNKYGDDTLDGSIVPFTNKEFHIARLKQFGIAIEDKDVKDQESIVGMSFLGYEFEDSEYGVRFVRYPKAITQFVHMKNMSDDERFLRVQGLKMLMAGNEVGLAIAEKLESEIVSEIPKLTRGMLVGLWTGRESLDSDFEVNEVLLEQEEIYDDVTGVERFTVRLRTTTTTSGGGDTKRRDPREFATGTRKQGGPSGSNANVARSEVPNWRKTVETKRSGGEQKTAKPLPEQGENIERNAKAENDGKESSEKAKAKNKERNKARNARRKEKRKQALSEKERE